MLLGSPSEPIMVIEIMVLQLLQCILVLLKKWSESLLLNTFYFEIPSILGQDLSLNMPLHLGSIVNTTMELEMNAATVP
jgi:hypothetical protein